MRLRTTWRILLGLLLLVGTTAPALADVVVLLNGAEFHGRVIRPTQREVTLQSDGRIMSFKLSEVRRVRRRGHEDFVNPVANKKKKPKRRGSTRSSRDDAIGRTWTPAGAPTRTERRVVYGQPAKAAREAANRASRTKAVKARLREKLTSVQGIELTAWTPTGARRLNVSVAQDYRVVRVGEGEVLSDELPTAPDGIQELWIRKPCRDAAPTDTGCHEWRRLFWHPERSSWQPLRPAESNLVEDGVQVGELLDEIVRESGFSDKKLRDATTQLAEAVKSGEKVDVYEARLRALTSDVGKAWAGGPLLFEACRSVVQIETAESSAQKVQLARERRSTIRSLVDRYCASRDASQ